jgi:hypothetical protein
MPVWVAKSIALDVKVLCVINYTIEHNRPFARPARRRWIPAEMSRPPLLVARTLRERYGRGMRC